MKRLAGVIMISVYMLSFAELHNIARFPVLLSHFNEHKQHNPQISFWAFIKQHYFSPMVQDEDYKRDRELPFRDSDCGQIVNSCICEITPFIHEVNPPAPRSTEYPLYNKNNKPQQADVDIFQPPRFTAELF